MCVLCSVSGHPRLDHLAGLEAAGRATSPSRLVDPTGDVKVDALLLGTAWTQTALTYAFPTQPDQFGDAGVYDDNAPFNGFQPLSGAARTAVRDAVAMVAEYTPLTFTEVPGGQGVIQSGLSAEVGDGAYAFGPGGAATSGDTFYEVTDALFANPRVGDEGYITILHEIGHAVGLAHGHTADEFFPALPAALDSNEFSLMTYRNYVGADPGDPSQAETFGYSQTFMTLDIAALQSLYGANYATRAGDTTYRVDPASGAFSIDGTVVATPGDNVVLRAIWDGGGSDTYDFSNYANGVTANLAPGGFSTLSQDQISRLDADGNQPARGNVFNAELFRGDARSLIENAVGGGGNDMLTGNVAANVLTGNAGRDTLTGGAGDDTLNGGADLDAAVFGVARASAQVTGTGGNGTVVSAEGTDGFQSVERLLFNDEAVAFDTGADQIAGVVFRTYQAAFNRAPDEPGLGFWIDQADKGLSFEKVAEGFLRSSEFTAAYGADPTDEAYVARLYQNILGRPGEQAGVDFWTKTLEQGASKAFALYRFTESSENIALTGQAVANGVVYDLVADNAFV